MKNKNNKRSMYKSMIISYCVLLITPLIFISVLQNEVQKSTKNNAYEYNSILLEQLETTMDSYHKELSLLALQFNANPKIQSITQNKNVSSLDIASLSGLMDDLRECKKNLSFISDIFLYIDSSDTIITPNNYMTSKQYFYNGYYQFEEFDYNTWRNTVLTGIHYNKYLPPTYLSSESSQKEIMLYVQSLPVSESEYANAQLIVEIDFNNIITMLNKICNLNDGNIIICDRNNDVFIDVNRKNTYNYESLKSLKNDHDFIYLREQKEYLMRSTTNDLQWTYYLLIPENTYLSKSSYFRYLSIILILIYIIIGVIEIKYFLKLNYSPLNTFLQEISKNHEAPISESKNEFDFIKQEFNSIRQSHDRLDKILNQTAPTVKNSLFSEILSGNTPKNADEILASINIKYTENAFAIVSVYIDDFPVLLKESADNEWELSRLAVANVFSELISEKYYCTVVDIWQKRLSIVINLAPSGEQTYYDDIYDISENVCEFFKTNFESRLSIGISTTRNELSLLSECYEESLVALDTKSDNKTDIMFYDDLSFNDSNFYYYPSEVETKILSAIISADEKEIFDILDNVVSVNRKHIKFTSSLKKCLCYDLYGTYMRIVSKLAIRGFSPNTKEQISLLETATLSEFVSDMKVKYHELIELRSTLNPSSGEQLINEISNFINENYADNSLTVLTIAEKFNISRQSMLAQFKQVKGMKPSDYITAVRIKHAMDILQNTDLTISQITQKVGYVSEDTFTRSFKKVTGITPGKFRETKNLQ